MLSFSPLPPCQRAAGAGAAVATRSEASLPAFARTLRPAGSGRTSPAAALASANPALTTRRPGSDTGSPLGRYGAVGSPSSQGAASSIGAAAEEALAAKLAATAISTGAGAGIDLPSSTASTSHVSVLSASPGDAMLPPGWAKVTDGQGLVYYVNHVTQEVSRRAVQAWGGVGLAVLRQPNRACSGGWAACIRQREVHPLTQGPSPAPPPRSRR